MFYFSTISWLRLQLLTLKEEMYILYRKVTLLRRLWRSLFHLFNANLFAVPLKNLNLNYYFQILQFFSHRINGGLSDKGCSSVRPPPRFCLFRSLICSPIKQPYSKWGNSRIYRYRNSVFTSLYFNAFMLLDLNKISFFLVHLRKVWMHHVMSQRRYFYSSKLCLILSKGGANSEDLNALGFYS